METRTEKQYDESHTEENQTEKKNQVGGRKGKKESSQRLLRLFRGKDKVKGKGDI